jgi:hypothetical protein
VNRFEAFGYSSDEESSSSLDENDEDSNFTGKKSFTTESITQSEDNCSTCCSCDSERGDCPVTVPKFVSVQLNGEWMNESIPVERHWWRLNSWGKFCGWIGVSQSPITVPERRWCQSSC